MGEPIRILLADQHALFREALRTGLENEPDLVVVAQARTGPEAVAEADRHTPHVAIVELLASSTRPTPDGVNMSPLETIELAVSVQRVFVFPAKLERTAAHFCDFTRVIGYLPYLRLIRTHAANQYRIVYSAAEGGIYHVTFTCDVRTHYDAASQTF